MSARIVLQVVLAVRQQRPGGDRIRWGIGLRLAAEMLAPASAQEVDAEQVGGGETDDVDKRGVGRRLVVRKLHADQFVPVGTDEHLLPSPCGDDRARDTPPATTGDSRRFRRVEIGKSRNVEGVFRRLLDDGDCGVVVLLEDPSAEGAIAQCHVEANAGYFDAGADEGLEKCRVLRCSSAGAENRVAFVRQDEIHVVGVNFVEKNITKRGLSPDMPPVKSAGNKIA